MQFVLPSHTVPPALWNLPLLAERPIALATEIEGASRAYRKKDPTHIDGIRQFYSERIVRAGYEPPQTTDLDTLGRAYLQARYYPNAVVSESTLPPFYYGYLQGNNHLGESSDRPLPIRVVGFVPPTGKIRGTVVHFKGFGHNAWENDPDLPARFMELGMAYFSFDLPAHGMSVRPCDPSVAAFRSARLFVEHGRQFLEFVTKVAEKDPRLQDKPLFGIGSSLGGAILMGVLEALLTRKEAIPFKRLTFDSPLWSFGNDWPALKRTLMGITLSLSSTFPSMAFHQKSPPKPREALSATFSQEHLAVYNAFGPQVVPIPMLDLHALVAANLVTLGTHADRLPPTALFVFDGDTQVDPATNETLFHQFTSNDRTCTIRTLDHNAFAATDPDLLKIWARFCSDEPLRASDRVTPL